MSHTQRLNSLAQLLALRAKALEKAHKALMHAKTQHQYALKKQEQIREYRQDYLQQLDALGNQGCPMERMRNRIAFIAQLDGILEQLHNEIAHLEKIKQRTETAFYHAKAEQEAVERLIEQVKQQHQYALNRMEQKQMDEHAQKQWAAQRLPKR